MTTQFHVQTQAGTVAVEYRARGPITARFPGTRKAARRNTMLEIEDWINSQSLIIDSS